MLITPLGLEGAGDVGLSALGVEKAASSGDDGGDGVFIFGAGVGGGAGL